MDAFYLLDDAQKQAVHERLLACAESFGGKNYFLQLCESIRETRPHPLIAKNSQFRMPLGIIKWNKVVFMDKLDLLQKVRPEALKNRNLLPGSEDKQYKKVINLVRTLKPIQFECKPKDSNDGEGFRFDSIEMVDDTKSVLDPVFDVVFFESISNVKKILNYGASK